MEQTLYLSILFVLLPDKIHQRELTHITQRSGKLIQFSSVLLPIDFQATEQATDPYSENRTLS